MPPAKRKGYTYLDQPGADGATSTTAVVRDRDGTGLGAFTTNPAIYAAIDADRALDPARVEHLAAFAHTHLDSKGPDLRAAAAQPQPDGTRQRS